MFRDRQTGIYNHAVVVDNILERNAVVYHRKEVNKPVSKTTLSEVRLNYPYRRYQTLVFKGH